MAVIISRNYLNGDQDGIRCTDRSALSIVNRVGWLRCSVGGRLRMFEEFFHSLMEQWSHGATEIFNQIGAAKVWAFAIPLVPASYGVWVKWRNSGYRMLDRLNEFVDRQEGRVLRAREELTQHFVIPPAHNPYEQPAFNARGLARSLRKLNWGFGPAAVGHLREATDVCAKRARLSARQSEEHLKRQALAHLLLGAKEAAKNFNDPQQRIATRAAALAEFEKALAISPIDAEALQYSGLMLLQLSRPVEAADRFSRLVEERRAGGGKPLSDAYKLEATAYENWPNGRRYLDASGSLNRAIQALPPGYPLELAMLHEHQGWVRKKAGVQSAINSFRAANHLYATLATAEGRDGLVRVREALDILNANDSTGIS